MNHELSEKLRYERTLSRDEQIALKNKRLGMTLFQISWIMVFGALVVVNWQIRFGSPTWPPEGAIPFNPVLPTLATIGLIASAVLAYRGNRAISYDLRQSFIFQWLGMIVLGVIFIAVMTFEWLTVPPLPENVVTLSGGVSSNDMVLQYYMLFRLMTAFHGLHALVIVIYNGVVWNRARKGAYGSHDSWAVEAGTKLWYFVVFAWMLFYVVLYWI